MLKKIFYLLLFSGSVCGFGLGALFVFLNRLGERSPDGYPQTPEKVIWALFLTGILSALISAVLANRKIRQKRLYPTILHYDKQSGITSKTQRF